MAGGVTLINEIRSTEWQLSPSGVGSVLQGMDDIRQCIRYIMLNRKGTDPLRPEFGCDIYQYLDRPVNQVVPQVKRAIIEAIGIWEPRVEVKKVEHQFDGTDLKFIVTFKIINSVEVGQVDIVYGIN